MWHISSFVGQATSIVGSGVIGISQVSTRGCKVITGRCFLTIHQSTNLMYFRNVGLFRYWTVSNLPLFLLAAPILWLLLTSSTTALHTGIQELRNRSHSVARQRPTLMAFSLPEIALPQFVLAVTALTNFHVQIVNRIASGYPTWYLTTAQWLVDSHHISSIPGPPLKVEWVVRGIIMYALVQGILYANFLPPA